MSKYIICLLFASFLVLYQTNWNRFETENFEILTIDKQDGEYLSKSVEFMTRWVYDRWGLRKTPFSVKCKILVVSDKTAFKDLFNKDYQTFRIDKNTKITESSIWIWKDPKWNTSILPYFITEICFAEFEQVNNVQLPLWFKKGICLLNRNLSDIKKAIKDISDIYDRNSPCFWTESLLTMTSDRLIKYSPENQELFEKESAVLCLYLIKTFDKKKLLDFVDSKNNLQIVGLTNYQDFDKVFNRYMFNLSKEVVGNKTPNSYLLK